MQTITHSDFEKQAAVIDKTIVDQVYIPTLVKLAAANGIPINTQEDLDNALTIIDLVEQHELARGGNMLKQAAEDLKALISGKPGQTKQASVQEGVIDGLVKTAWNDPMIRQSVLQGTRLLLAKENGLIVPDAQVAA